MSTTLDWSTIRVGDPVTPMTIDVTTTVVVAGAIATRDFMPVHHDRDYASSQGSPEIFMNIMTDNGLCRRFLTDWAGPELHPRHERHHRGGAPDPRHRVQPGSRRRARPRHRGNRMPDERADRAPRVRRRGGPGLA